MQSWPWYRQVVGQCVDGKDFQHALDHVIPAGVEVERLNNIRLKISNSRSDVQAGLAFGDMDEDEYVNSVVVWLIPVIVGCALLLALSLCIGCCSPCCYKRCPCRRNAQGEITELSKRQRICLWSFILVVLMGSSILMALYGSYLAAHATDSIDETVCSAGKMVAEMVEGSMSADEQTREGNDTLLSAPSRRQFIGLSPLSDFLDEATDLLHPESGLLPQTSQAIAEYANKTLAPGAENMDYLYWNLTNLTATVVAVFQNHGGSGYCPFCSIAPPAILAGVDALLISAMEVFTREGVEPVKDFIRFSISEKADAIRQYLIEDVNNGISPESSLMQLLEEIRSAMTEANSRIKRALRLLGAATEDGETDQNGEDADDGAKIHLDSYWTASIVLLVFMSCFSVVLILAACIILWALVRQEYNEIRPGEREVRCVGCTWIFAGIAACAEVLLCGAMIIVVVVGSDACHIVQEDLLQNNRYSDLSIFGANFNRDVAEVLEECASANGNGDILAALNLQVYDLVDFTRELGTLDSMVEDLTALQMEAESTFQNITAGVQRLSWFFPESASVYPYPSFPWIVRSGLQMWSQNYSSSAFVDPATKLTGVRPMMDMLNEFTTRTYCLDAVEECEDQDVIVIDNDFDLLTSPESNLSYAEIAAAYSISTADQWWNGMAVAQHKQRLLGNPIFPCPTLDDPCYFHDFGPYVDASNITSSFLASYTLSLAREMIDPLEDTISYAITLLTYAMQTLEDHLSYLYVIQDNNYCGFAYTRMIEATNEACNETLSSILGLFICWAILGVINVLLWVIVYWMWRRLQKRRRVMTAQLARDLEPQQPLTEDTRADSAPSYGETGDDGSSR